MRAVKIIGACFLLAGCAVPAPRFVILKETVTKVDHVRVPAQIPSARLKCSPDPAYPANPNQITLAAYASRLLAVADECRADLAALGAK